MPKVTVESGLVPSSPSTGLVASVGLVPSGGGSRFMGPETGSGACITPNGHSTPDVAGSDFVVLDEPKRQTVGMVFARDGHGKTHFVTHHCPDPVVVIGLDGRGEREIKAAIGKGRRVYYLDASMPANASQMSHEEAQRFGEASLGKIGRNYEWAIEKSIRDWGRGTLVFDTSTELRDIVRFAIRGRADRPQPKKGEKGDWGAADAVINRTLKYFCDRSRQSYLNLILLARSKPIYEGREDTGRITWDTDKIFSQAVDWTIEYRMVPGLAMGGGLVGGIQMLGGPTIMTPPTATGPTYEIVATDPKCARLEMGNIYRQQDWESAGIGPFAYVMVRLIPRSKSEDWQ